MAERTFSHSSLGFDTWLPLLGGVAAGIGVAALMTSENWVLLAPLVLALPAILLFIRYPLVAIMIWLLAFPFLVELQGAGPRYLYWILHRAMIPVVLGLVVLTRGRSRHRQPVRFGLPELFMLFFLLYVVANILVLGKTRIPSLIHVYDRLFVPFCMYALVRLLAPSPADMLRLMPVAFVSLLVQCGVSFLSWFKPDVLPEYWLHPGRTTGSLGSPAIYTGVLMFFTLLLLQYAVDSQKRWLRSIVFLAVLLGFFGVFFSFSRGSWVGGLLVLIGLIRLYPRTMLRAAVVVAVVLVLAGSVFLQQEFSWASQRLENQKTAEDRIIIFVAGASMAAARPLFGWGYDNYNSNVARFTQNVGDIYYDKTHSSHNSTMTILAELGLVGFVLSVLPVALWLRRSLKIRRLMPQTGFAGWPFLALLWLCLLNLFAVSCFSDIVSTANPAGLALFWMTLGFVGSLVDPYFERGQPRSLSSGATSPL